MSLEHTLLGLLILHPRTGYDLYKRMAQATFLLESATLRRIYPTLKRMTEDGLVVYQVEPQEGRPDRKVYSVTDKGEAEFLVWLREPSAQDDDTWQRLFSRFFFYGMLDGETLLARLRDVLAARREKLQVLQSTDIAPPLGPCREIVDDERVTEVWNLMLDYGRMQVQTQIEWLQDVIERVEDEL
jgi:PadR family transcriptional regulator AphA